VKDGISESSSTPECHGIADAVKSLLRDPLKARLMGESGREMVKEFHTEAGMIKNYIDELKRALNGKS
jgi:glycosyltransferase involved in cell wall biosynthesis